MKLLKKGVTALLHLCFQVGRLFLSLFSTNPCWKILGVPGWALTRTSGAVRALELDGIDRVPREQLHENTLGMALSVIEDAGDILLLLRQFGRHAADGVRLPGPALAQDQDVRILGPAGRV